jgi:hypothetical protein
MTNQTLPSDANNRYKKGINTFENELRSIWLGKGFLKITFTDPLGSEINIAELDSLFKNDLTA